MKLKFTSLLPLVLLAAALLPQAAFADTLTLTLANPIQSVTTAGGTLSYSGTIKAASNNTGQEYLNGDSFSFSGPGTLDDTAFFSTPLFLSAGQSFTGLLFTVTLNNNAAVGTYLGSFSILGGSNDSMSNTLATASFQANVQKPAAVAVAPEPSSLALLATGAVGAVAAMRRRLQLS